MLGSLKELQGYKVKAMEDNIGDVDDFLFDDETAHVRYLVVSTGTWCFGRKVLISPTAVGRPDRAKHGLLVRLTKEEIKKSPEIDWEKPVSRQMEAALHRYYGWPPYWGFPSLHADVHLRSSKEVIGYHIQARDGEIGHIEDFLVDDESWIIRYLVVETRNWLPGKKVVLSPAWIDDVNWSEQSLYVDLEREEIRNAPQYDPNAQINRGYEERLYDYYARPKYWVYPPGTG